MPTRSPLATAKEPSTFLRPRSSALLLGPGTTVSQQAMVLIAESGSTAVWVGEQGVRYYAHGRSLAQVVAACLRPRQHWCRTSGHGCAWRGEMYAMRFPGEDTSWSDHAAATGPGRGAGPAGVPRARATHRRRHGPAATTTPTTSPASTPINQALSAANTSLYGVVHAVIVALGCAPGLGFVHTGHVLSFVFDIADLYKADIAIPIAFDIAAPKSTTSPPRRAERSVTDMQTALVPRDLRRGHQGIAARR